MFEPILKKMNFTYVLQTQIEMKLPSKWHTQEAQRCQVTERRRDGEQMILRPNQRHSCNNKHTHKEELQQANPLGTISGNNYGWGKGAVGVGGGGGLKIIHLLRLYFCCSSKLQNLSQRTTKPTIRLLRPAKTQIRLRIRAV